MKNIGYFLFLGLLAFLFTSCYWQPDTGGGIVIELGAPDDFTTLDFDTLAKPDNPGNSGGNPNVSAAPPFAQVTLYLEHKEVVNGFAEVDLTGGEQPATASFDDLAVGDGYTVKVELGNYDAEGVFVPTHTDVSARFKIFSSRNTKVRVNPRPI